MFLELATISIQAVTIGEIASALRDFAIIGVIFTAFKYVWKIRGLYEDVQKFFIRVTTHMDTMEKFAQVAVRNHLNHMERDLASLAGRTQNYASSSFTSIGEEVAEAEAEAATAAEAKEA
jgi:hypothetical protein